MDFVYRMKLDKFPYVDHNNTVYQFTIYVNCVSCQKNRANKNGAEL